MTNYSIDSNAMIDTNQSLHCNYFCKHQMHQQKHGRDGSPSFSLLLSVESDFFASTCRDKNLVEYKTKSCGPTFWFIQQIGVQFWLWLFRKIFGILKSITEIKQKFLFCVQMFPIMRFILEKLSKYLTMQTLFMWYYMWKKYLRSRLSNVWEIFQY